MFNFKSIEGYEKNDDGIFLALMSVAAVCAQTTATQQCKKQTCAAQKCEKVDKECKKRCRKVRQGKAEMRPNRPKMRQGKAKMRPSRPKVRQGKAEM